MRGPAAQIDFLATGVELLFRADLRASDPERPVTLDLLLNGDQVGRRRVGGWQRSCLVLPSGLLAAHNRVVFRSAGGVTVRELGVEPASLLAPSRRVDARAAEEFLGEGWGPPEGELRFVAGREADLLFLTERHQAVTLLARFEPRGGAQRLVLAVDGSPIASEHLEVPTTIAADLPANPATRLRRLSLRLPDASEAQRLGLRWFAIAPAAAAAP